MEMGCHAFMLWLNMRLTVISAEPYDSADLDLDRTVPEAVDIAVLKSVNGGVALKHDRQGHFRMSHGRAEVECTELDHVL